MFQINEDLSIYITRGDTALFSVTAEKNGKSFLFQPDDVVRLNVYEKKNCDDVVVRKDFTAKSETDRMDILLTKEDTKIGKIISKPADYWYEIVLNPVTNPQTIIGYDEDGAKLFRIYPEGNDEEEIEKEDIPVVDDDFSSTSERPLKNHVITRRFSVLEDKIDKTAEKITSKDIVPITKAEYDELYEKGTWEENVVYLVLGAEYNPDEDKTALEIANDALATANDALEIARDPYKNIPIEKGGTGATTVEGALENLGLTNKANIEVGSYVGTGTLGNDNPCILTFDFVPKILFVYPNDRYTDNEHGALFIRGVTIFDGFGTYYSTSGTVHQRSVTIAWNGNEVSWYSTDSKTQQNEIDITYFYVALG